MRCNFLDPSPKSLMYGQFKRGSGALFFYEDPFDTAYQKKTKERTNKCKIVLFETI